MSRQGVAGTGRIRCAIYTRKSTEEGLEQEFNSLDAQHEACAAYILSQRHEGWTQVQTRYDDGGYSGGNMDRPGLKQLMADIGAGKVDVIVVYKVDRLTRSLADFAKIVEVLDAKGASFVSVTQAFNTTTSMGRLTLNVLLSFAQFEREVTGERIRDKIAASKARGMWMGGPVPLGYDLKERKLIINPAEADLVRHIFTRYATLGSGQKLVEELRADGHRTKLRPHKDGSVVGGVPFGRGMLFQLLANRLYLGEIVHKGTAHPGEHEAIIDQALWDAVQQQVAANRVERKERHNIPNASLLAGVIWDGHGRRMSPSHANKHVPSKVEGGKLRYRYYITHASALHEGDPPAWRMPAYDIERIVIDRIRQLFEDRQAIRSLLQSEDAHARDIAAAFAVAAKSAEQMATPYRRTIVTNIVTRVTVEEAQVRIEIDRQALLRRLGMTGDTIAPPIELIAPAAKIRRGSETRLVIPNGNDASPQRDEKLIALLLEAQATRNVFVGNPALTVVEHARFTGQCRKRLTRLLRLSWLAPSIVQAIAEGRQPPQLTAKMLLTADLPITWSEQASQLGFA